MRRGDGDRQPRAAARRSPGRCSTENDDPLAPHDRAALTGTPVAGRVRRRRRGGAESSLAACGRSTPPCSRSCRRRLARASHWPGSPGRPPSAAAHVASTPGSTSPAGRASSWPGAPRPGCPRSGSPSTCAPGRARSPRRSCRPGRRHASSATDTDAGAVVCARANGVEARRGDLFAPVPCRSGAPPTSSWPSCPTSPRRPCACSPTTPSTSRMPTHYDGGRDGTDVLRRVVTEAA